MAELPRLRVGLTLDSATFVRETNRVIDAVNNMSRELQRQNNQMARSFDGMQRGIESISRSMTHLGRLFQIGSFSLLARQAALTADSFVLLRARLEAFGESAQDAVQVQQALIDISNSNRVGIQQSADLYTRLALILGQVGVSSQQLLAVTDLVGKTTKIAGGNAIGAAAGLYQFSQAMGRGVLRGDEFRSVMEQVPGLALSIARGLGTTTDQLEKMARQGKLTTNVVLNALLADAPKIEEQFARLPVTVGDAFTLLRNSLAELVGSSDKASNASNTFALAIKDLAETLRSSEVTSAFRTFVTELLVLMREEIERTKRDWETLVGVFNQTRDFLSQFGITNPVGLEAISNRIADINGELARMIALNREEAAGPQKAVRQATIDALNEERKALIKRREEIERTAKASKNLDAFQSMNDAELRRRQAARVPPIKAKTGISAEDEETIKRQTKALKDLQTQSDQLRRLLEAQEKGERAFTAVKIAIDGENAARRVGLDLSSKMGRAIATEAANVEDLTQRLRENKEEMDRVARLRNEEFQRMNEEELKRRQGQAGAADLSRPELPDEKELSEPFKNALEDIQAEFTDTFEELSQGAIRSFEDIALAATDIFTRMAANIATLSLSPLKEDKAQFAQMAQEIGLSSNQLRGLALAPSLIGLGIGLTGNRGAIEGANQGAGIGAGIGALAGFAIPGVGPILGSMAGGLVGQAAGGLFGGLFGDGESPGPANDTGPLSFRSTRGFSGPFGGIALGNTEREFRGPLTQMIRQFDQGVAQFLTGRQEALIGKQLQALEEFSGRFPESDPSAAFLQIMKQRGGAVLQGAGIGAAARGRILSGAGSAEDIASRVGEALQLFQQIQDLKLGPVRSQFAALDRQFDEQITTARRLGLSTSGMIGAPTVT